MVCEKESACVIEEGKKMRVNHESQNTLTIKQSRDKENRREKRKPENGKLMG